jgi:hypothetical protein
MRDWEHNYHSDCCLDLYMLPRSTSTPHPTSSSSMASSSHSFTRSSACSLSWAINYYAAASGGEKQGSRIDRIGAITNGTDSCKSWWMFSSRLASLARRDSDKRPSTTRRRETIRFCLAQEPTWIDPWYVNTNTKNWYLFTVCVRWKKSMDSVLMGFCLDSFSDIVFSYCQTSQTNFRFEVSEPKAHINQTLNFESRYLRQIKRPRKVAFSFQIRHTFTIQLMFG